MLVEVKRVGDGDGDVTKRDSLYIVNQLNTARIYESNNFSPKPETQRRDSDCKFKIEIINQHDIAYVSIHDQ